MAEVAQIDYTINGAPAAQTLGELETKAEQLRAALGNAQLGSDEFKRINQELVQTNKQVKNLELGFEALDKEKVASELGSVAGAIGDITSAFVLLGGESDTMQKVAANVQQAIGISMAFKGAIEGASSAMKLFNNVLRANPIGLIVTAIALLIAGIVALIMNFDKVKDSLASVAIWVKDLIDWFGAWKYVILALLGPIGWLIAALDLLFGSEVKQMSELEKLRQKQEEKRQAQMKAITDDHKARLKQIQDEREAEQDAFEARQDEFDLQIDRMEAEGKNADALKRAKIEAQLEHERVVLESINREIDSWRKYYEEQFILSGKSREDFIAQMKGRGIDLVKLQEDANKLLEAQQVKIYQSETNLIRLNRELREKNAKATKDENDALFEQQKALQQARLDFLTQLEAAENEYLDSKLTAQEREINAVRDKYFVLIEEANKYGEDTAILEEAQQARIAEINQKYIDLADAKRKEQDEKEKAAEEERIARNRAAAQSLFDAANGLQQLLHDRELKRANEKVARGENLTKKEIARLKRQDAINKAFALAEIARDTAQGVMAAVAAGAKIPFPGNLFAIASGVAAVIAGATQAAQILGEAVEIPSVASNTGTNAGSIEGNNTETPVINPVQAGSTFLNNEPQKVYVVESDITEKQNKVKAIISEATYG